ncbi:mitochondrial distribution/morphology family 35/apoptosis [Protomyces lactucae-debilis]|uniref:Mitochondrial distribution/morphology family 35/apoptosis n=1 Tax=Protomyces lactucae-debilis TaxID=2754530 RepID=A0A1Y2FMZ0_PROLT|nr:mitochondrial distribution/morphology family 35/apoptosis [Protomyces lactucae-debilis]ORY84947.1 mitochondrial distribution/morphology family 35/apoptosis [Protomyces lactucae-debilis]
MSASIGGPECTKLKKEYDECFNDWYTNQFLAGKSNLNECEDLFIDYKACVQKAMAEKQILPLLEQARREAPFEDGGRWKSK